MNDADLKAYLAWRAACERYAQHLDANKLYGGDCEVEDAQGRAWVFTFQPAQADND